MIKFFRKIRRQLLSENRFSKYLFYAIGEIVLVVIGILIALQINNWNEERKLSIETKNLKYRLSKQLSQNIKYAEYSIENSKKSVQTLSSLMQMMGVLNSKHSRRNIDSLISYSIMDFYLGLDLNTLSEAKENGEIAAIINDTLRSALYRLTAINEMIIEREQIANADNNRYMVPYIYKNLNKRNLGVSRDLSFRKRFGSSTLDETNYEKLFQDREFENLIHTRLYYAEEMLTTYESTKAYLESTLQLLEKK